MPHSMLLSQLMGAKTMRSPVPSAALSTVDVKFLLQLLGSAGYRTEIELVQPNPKTSVAERDRICARLQAAGWVDYTYEVTRFTSTAAGRLLLNLHTTSLPLTPLELWVLRACCGRVLSPSELPSKIPAQDCQRVLRQLSARRLLQIKQRKLKSVWLTQQGQQWLKALTLPTGLDPVLRQRHEQFTHGCDPLGCGQSEVDFAVQRARQQLFHGVALGPQSLVLLIQALDRSLKTGNLLPLFHLREYLQPPLTRVQLDRDLRCLEQQVEIEFTCLEDLASYSDSQVAAGLVQPLGAILFFVSLI